MAKETGFRPSGEINFQPAWTACAVARVFPSPLEDKFQPEGERGSQGSSCFRPSRGLISNLRMDSLRAGTGVFPSPHEGINFNNDTGRCDARRRVSHPSRGLNFSHRTRAMRITRDFPSPLEDKFQRSCTRAAAHPRCDMCQFSGHRFR